MPDTVTAEFRNAQIKRFAIRLGLAAAILALIPALIGFLTAGPDRPYLGFQYNSDDHLVYAAWMRQAMDGQLLFDNRFTTDAQPGLTIHVYFLVLGWIAKVIGIAATFTLTRAAFSFCFVVLLASLLRRSSLSVFATKAALTLSVISGGIGFLVWQNFGVALNPGASSVAQTIALGRLPTDVWQPEGFVLPSMLTSSLFMASLCLIIWIFRSVVDARESWKPVISGAIGFMLLMNIHSYDVLLVGLVLLGFLCALGGSTQLKGIWVLRVGVMVLGVLPAAAWFAYVLQNDPVFQARASTPTFSPNFRQIIAGYLPLGLLGLYWLVRSSFSPVTTLAEDRNAQVQDYSVFGGGQDTVVSSGSVAPVVPVKNSRVWIGAALSVSIVIGWIAAGTHLDGYWMAEIQWGAVFLSSLLLLFFFGKTSSEKPVDVVTLLVFAWAVIGMIAPYFPALFERKLMMGLSIPWAILAALGLEKLGTAVERGTRNLATALCLVVLFASSLRWVFREIEFVKQDVSNTTVHPVFLSRDAANIVSYLNGKKESKTVVLAMPGIPRPTTNPDVFESPNIPDLNPIVSGLTGVYTVAGHWSETPEYGLRRNELLKNVYLMPNEAARKSYYSQVNANYVIDVFKAGLVGIPVVDLSKDGDIVVDGTRFRLIKLKNTLR